MADVIALDLVTPEKRLVSTEVAELTAITVDGEVGIMPAHANYITVLDAGQLSYIEDGETKRVAISGGFAEVTLDEGVRIMAETAEFAEDLDRERALSAKERAERRIKDYDPGTQELDMVRAEAALKRAIIRIDVAG
ncbi:MAG: F0F1 ATP synthase subunit epsilon [bacterium]|nr:F0F1 ATP synthase subunit epsilon [bacterium]